MLKIRQESNSRPPLFFKKSFYKVKVASFHYISIALELVSNKNELYKTSDYCFRSILNFDFLEKGLRIFSPPKIFSLVILY